MESQPNTKVFQSIHHKGGSNINNILHINNNKDNTFSFDEYRNAIETERVKRQIMLKTDNDELLNRRELKRANNLNDPKLFEKNQQLSNRVMTERMKQNISKNIRNHHNEIFESNHDEAQTKRELMRLDKLNDPTLVENNKQLSNCVMSERVKQTLSTNIRKHHNEVFEAQQYVDKYNSIGGKPKDNNWNINNITFETSENGSQITRVVIRKKRGDKQNEMIVPNL